MNTIKDTVINDAKNLPENAGTLEGLKLLSLESDADHYAAANLYIEALLIIKSLLENASKDREMQLLLTIKDLAATVRSLSKTIS